MSAPAAMARGAESVGEAPPIDESQPPVAVRLVERIEQASSLDPIAGRVEGFLWDALPNGKPRELIEGRWLGHALHPALSDLPVGAWTSSVILDLLGAPGARRDADLLIGVGLVAALPVALSGWTDWSHADETQQRVGLAHAAANISATLLFTASLRSRLRGRRGLGKLLSIAGIGAAGAGAYAGGHLAFARGAGMGQRG